MSHRTEQRDRAADRPNVLVASPLRLLCLLASGFGTIAIAAPPAMKPGESVRLPARPATAPVGDPFPSDKRPNIAGLATASASTSQAGHVADDAIDGSTETRWCADSGGEPEWWQAVFAVPQQLEAVELDWEFPRKDYRFRLETSSDGSKWDTAFDASAGAKSPVLATIAARHGREVRGVRVHFLGSDGGWGSLREVRLLAPEGTAAPPPRTAIARRRDDGLDGHVKAPPEFTATIFATSAQVNYPVFVAATHDGTLFVSSDGNGSLGRDPHRGRIVRLRDADGDGTADDVRDFVAELDSPRGVVWVDDRLVVLHPPDVSSFRDIDGDGVADERKLLVQGIAFDYSKRPADHTSNGLALGIDGWIYAAIGDFGFMDAVGPDGRRLQLRGGGLVRFRPDGTGLDLFARGTRNTLEAAVSPLLDMIARDNTNDGGGWNVRLHAFTGLEDHGYPRRYMHFADEIMAPLADYGGGSGTGGCWIDEPWMPDRYNDAAFTCDWGRNQIYRHPISRIGAGYAAEQEDFLGLPRATDLDADAAGHLYAASWRNGGFSWSGPDVGFIARLTPKAASITAGPPPASRMTAELVGLLGGRSHRLRLEAQRLLLTREWTSELTAAIEHLACDPAARPAGRIAAVFTLALRRKADALPILVTLSADPSLSPWSVRALGDLAAEGVAVPTQPVLDALAASDARTRKEAVVAAVRMGDVVCITHLLPRTVDPDAVVAHAAVEGLVRLAKDHESEVIAACTNCLDGPDTPPPLFRAATRVLAELHCEPAVDAVLSRLASAGDAKRRIGLAWAAARLWQRESAWGGESWGTRPDTRGPYYAMERWAASERLERSLLDTTQAVESRELPELARTLGLHHLPPASVVPCLLRRSEAGEALVRFLEVSGESPPPEAVQPISVTATASDVSPSVRVDALRVLTRRGQPSVLPAIADATLLLESSRDADAEAATARVLARDAAAAFGDLSTLDSLARRGSAHAGLVDEMLLSIAGSSVAKSGIRGTAAARLASDWNSSFQRRTALANASIRSGSKVLASHLVAAVDDEQDTRMQSIARDAIERLGIDAKKIRAVTADAGPRIRERPTPQVLDLIDEQRGDKTVGMELFVSTKCGSCHAATADGQGLGPSLANAAAIYSRRQLAESVLLPNKSIAQGFATTSLVLEDGRQLVGFITSEAADRVLLRDAQGAEHAIATRSIEDRRKLPTSTMPEGLVGDLTIGQFTSLLDFIESIGK